MSKLVPAKPVPKNINWSSTFVLAVAIVVVVPFTVNSLVSVKDCKVIS